MVNVAVTGVTGMIGGAVGRCFAESGHTVRGVARSTSRHRRIAVRRGNGSDARRRVAPSGTDRLRDRRALRGSVCVSVRRTMPEVSSVNVDGTRTLMEAAKDAGVPPTVITSSSVTAGSSLDGSVHDERHSIGTNTAHRISAARSPRARGVTDGRQ